MSFFIFSVIKRGSGYSLLSPLASLLISTQYVCMIETSRLNKQDNTKFALDPKPPSSCYPTFLLHLMVKHLESSHCFHFWFLICSSSTVRWLFTSLSSLKLPLPKSPMTFIKFSKYLFSLLEASSLIFFSLLFPFSSVSLPQTPLGNSSYSPHLLNVGVSPRFWFLSGFHLMHFVDNLVHIHKALVIAYTSYILILTVFWIFLLISSSQIDKLCL